MAPPRRTVAAFTDPYIDQFTPPPPVRDGVCDVCHGAPSPGWSRCYSCSQTMGQVSKPISRVVPISLYEPGGPLHHVLRGYKDGYTDETRRQLRPRVAAILWRFLAAHEPCIANAVGGTTWDAITSVPSSGERQGTHPLEQAIALAAPLAEQYEPMLERADGPLGHNCASDTGYRVIQDVDGRNVLLVDDTFTSGARIQSAASVLTLAGANVIAAVPIGRFIRPGWNAAAQSVWDDARDEGFDFEVCCLEP